MSGSSTSSGRDSDGKRRRDPPQQVPYTQYPAYQQYPQQLYTPITGSNSSNPAQYPYTTNYDPQTGDPSEFFTDQTGYTSSASYYQPSLNDSTGVNLSSQGRATTSSSSSSSGQTHIPRHGFSEPPWESSQPPPEMKGHKLSVYKSQMKRKEVQEEIHDILVAHGMAVNGLANQLNAFLTLYRRQEARIRQLEMELAHYHKLHSVRP